VTAATAAKQGRILAAAGMPRSRFITLGILSAFGPLSLDLYLPSLPRIGADFGVSDGTIGLTLSGCILGLAAGQLIVGPLSDRFGRRRPLMIGLGTFILTSFLCAVAPAAWFLILMRLLQGLAGATGLVIGRATVRDIAPTERLAHVFSMLGLINGIAPIVAPLLGGVLLHVMPWRGLFVVLGCIGAVITTCAVIFLPESLPPERRHKGGLAEIAHGLRALAHDRLFVGGALLLACGSASMFTYISLSSFVLQDHFGLTASQFSLVFAANSVGLWLAARVSALLLRSRTPTDVLIIAVLIMAAADATLILAAQADLGLPVFLPALWVAVGVTGMVFPNATGIALAGHQRNAGTASAVLGTMQFAAGGISGPVASLFGVSPTSMAIAMMSWATVSVLIWVAFLKHRRTYSVA
jgi:DHA1 family bicyclomycin/chloramphenicol resistance-like MFS transporter